MTSTLSNSSLHTLPALKNFDLFSILPLEMRFIIWSYWFPAPRTVEIEVSTKEHFPFLFYNILEIFLGGPLQFYKTHLQGTPTD
jgi:2EXR family